MGLFGKIKENFNHGGVKVSVQAPASVSMNDAAGLPVTVTLTNNDEQRTINKVSVEIIATSQDQGFDSSGATNNTTSTNKTVARADNTQPFALMPGETKSVQLTIVMNSGAAVAAQLPEGSGMAQVADALGKLQAVGEAMHGDSWTYQVQAKADVEGVTLDPMDQKPLQVLKPGQIGGAINI